MQYKELGRTGEKVSVLGFGIMRLPYTQDEPKVVDLKQSYEMIQYAYDNGVNYFDTAQNYMKGESETILGEAVKGFREKIYLATKVGIWHLQKDIRDIEELLEGQLERLQTDYIDFYMIHALTDDRWTKFREAGIIDFFERKKREGVIRHYGFSYHGTPFFFQKIVDEYDWEFVQLQFNYVDRNIQAGEQGLIYADQKGLGTIIMEPLRGGQLVQNLPEQIKTVLQSVAPHRTMADFGLNWLWNREDVDLVLSGMSNMSQVEENIRFAAMARPGMMSQVELGALQEAEKMYSSMIQVKCTLCRYCLPCPSEINIPSIFNAYNMAFTGALESGLKRYRHETSDATPCLECGQCEEKCPQSILIREKLKEISAFFKLK
jgi:predicted aldo/keto reductase-like oxidoreductase